MFKLVFTGGGTAGHVWPHFAIASELQRSFPALPQAHSTGAQVAEELEFHYLGSEKGMEREIVRINAPEWHYHSLSTGKLRRYFSVENFKDVFRVFKGFFDALAALKQIAPQAVFSKGGFVAAPVVWAAWFLRIPIFIHESDATPALATKLCLPFCTRAFVAFPDTLKWVPNLWKSKVLVSGLPMRPELFQGNREKGLALFGFRSELPVLLVFGGSLGAEALNQKVRLALADLLQDVQVLHIVGKGKGFDPQLPDAQRPRYVQKEFLTKEMSEVYAIADLALCRAGASSIFELKEAAVPMLLVPLGLHQSRGDQIVNAKIFTRQGFADWREELDLSAADLCLWVRNSLRDLPAKKSHLLNSSSTPAREIIAKEILNAKH